MASWRGNGSGVMGREGGNWVGLGRRKIGCDGIDSDERDGDTSGIGCGYQFNVTT